MVKAGYAGKAVGYYLFLRWLFYCGNDRTLISPAADGIWERSEAVTAITYTSDY